MSRQGVIGPLRLSPQHATVVGNLIGARTAGFGLDRTPFAALPSLGRKLSRAAARCGRTTTATFITMWTVERAEALAGFSYLALFSRPDVPSTFLSVDEAAAVHEVVIDIAVALLARKGAKKLDRAAIENQLRAWQQPATSEHDPDPPNERWVRRLKQRVAREGALGQTPLRPIPTLVLALLAPRETTGN